MVKDWTELEVELIVKDYFSMLHAEMNHISYSKTQHRNSLKSLMPRTDSSIESKHRNISAILIEQEQPFVYGYKPLFHYQKLLERKVIEYLNSNNKNVESDFENFTNSSPKVDLDNLDFLNIIIEEPVLSKIKTDIKRQFKPIKTNYLLKEQNNSAVGKSGEEIVFQYEKYRLVKAGKEKLASKVEWIAKEKGDGAGFDILSKNDNGSDRFIEVKTTRLSKETPIYLSNTEADFADENSRNFFLYRVFNLESKPQIFIKRGRYDLFCHLQSVTYKGFFK
jgi:hypothetical protein